MLAVGLAALPGCEPSNALKFNNVDVTGANYGKTLQLTDTEGRQRSLKDFRGRLVALFFGYTQCPDVCPTALQEWRQIRQALGPDGQRLQVVFVTIDPERDTAELLRNYLQAFDPSFVALRGDAQRTAAAAKEFKVFYQKVPGSAPNTYTMDHTAGSYILDAQGRLRLFIRPGATTDSVVQDLNGLLRLAG